MDFQSIPWQALMAGGFLGVIVIVVVTKLVQEINKGKEGKSGNGIGSVIGSLVPILTKMSTSMETVAHELPKQTHLLVSMNNRLKRLPRVERQVKDTHELLMAATTRQKAMYKKLKTKKGD